MLNRSDPCGPSRGQDGTRPRASDPSATLLAVRATNAPDIQHEHRLHITVLAGAAHCQYTVARPQLHGPLGTQSPSDKRTPDMSWSAPICREQCRGLWIKPRSCRSLLSRVGARRQCGGGGCRARWACSRCWAMRHRCPRSAPCPPGHGRAGGASVGNGPVPTLADGGRGDFVFDRFL